jgi:hypothetical protein
VALRSGHDLCYSTCGTTKEYCEKVFKSCMSSVCRTTYASDPQTRGECDKQAQSMTGLTAAFGGRAVTPGCQICGVLDQSLGHSHGVVLSIPLSKTIAKSTTWTIPTVIDLTVF